MVCHYVCLLFHVDRWRPTSGTGGVYPAGLLVGEVVSIAFNKYDASRSAVIKPFEDVRSITSAAVITGFASSGKVVRADEN